MLGVLAFIELFPSPRYSYFWDRTYDTGHIVVFGIGVMMTLTVIRAFLNERAIPAQYVGAGVFTFLLGVIVEVRHSFVPTRSAEFVDVYSDFMGIVALLHCTQSWTSDWVPREKAG